WHGCLPKVPCAHPMEAEAFAKAIVALPALLRHRVADQILEGTIPWGTSRPEARLFKAPASVS
ncbi:hypothetical protein N9F34_05920, partial [Alphaproteobacteria bacterium]|nr:hypothetical protein [Alphaproteobacteria bacterium]